MFRYGISVDADDYQKRRKAEVKHYGGDVAKTTKILDLEVDLEVEWHLIHHYCVWTELNKRDAVAETDDEREEYFGRLLQETRVDRKEVEQGFDDLGIQLAQSGDGVYWVKRLGFPESIPAASIQASPDEAKGAASSLPITGSSPPTTHAADLGQGGGSQSSSHTPPITTSRFLQPPPSASETTPLLSGHYNGPSLDPATPSSVIICGCPCS